MSNRQLPADLGLLLIAAIWGGTFVMVKEAVLAYTVFGFLALRFALASLVLSPWWGRLRGLSKGEWGAGLLTGLFFFGGYAFQTTGLQYTTVSKTGFITGLYTVFVPILSMLVLRQRPGRNAVLGVALATVGLGLLSLRGDLTVAAGDVLVLGGALCFAAHIVAVGRFSPAMDALALTTLQLLAVTLASAGASLAVERSSLAIPWGVWGAAAFTGVVATSLVLFLQTTAQRFTTPTHTALILATEPVFAALFAYVLAGEVLGRRALLGCGLILAGMMVAEAP